MNSEELAALSLAAFDHMVAATPGFRSRTGQRDMAQDIATTLAGVDLGAHDDPIRSVAVIQAGTGVGKSAAYAATLVAMAQARKTRLLISTATVALQEQLMTKDLPALAAVLPTPFSYALAKGRARYVCKLKLEQWSGLPGVNSVEMFESDEDVPPSPSTATRANSKTQDPEERRMELFDSLAQALANGTWNGDRDQLAEQPDGQDWALVAAERHTCTVRHCPRFRQCSYYQARNALAEADVIVANHDLVLASLGMKTLPDLDNCLVVFDEGHHLPAVALDQFSSSMDLSNLRWLDRLPRIMLEVGEKMHSELGEDVTTLARELKTALHDLGRLMMDLLRSTVVGYDGTQRWPGGVLPEALHEPVGLSLRLASSLATVLDDLGAQIKLLARDDPSQALHCSMLYARLGPLSPKLGSVVSTCELLLEHGPQPLAKWLKSDTGSGLVVLTVHACPMVPGDLLRQHLWTQVRGAVVTSATLASCGTFEYFLAEAGLSGDPNAHTLEVHSPFDYSTQGRLMVVETAADPKHVDAYTREMVTELIADLALVQRGALVLFTSRVQMKVATDSLAAALMEVVLVQGQMSRTRLLAAHQARVEAGRPSVIFGQQSFGEGLDLPGALCETVFIAKLPFTPPSDPVEEARAEWLKTLGRDPFAELVIPATGIRLLQWTGRAIRTEEDYATVICYDKRLLRSGYGKRMLRGLPGYEVLRRVNGVIEAA
ncbi:ATP-dependent DNA helicase DinG [Rhodoferax sp.]|uniref:ATP-dependent DNA helicase DinG n=1 Tax=Rhodoferax sp. TaxID=50421 RepID=UPI00276C1E96|nr:ATP-dependent DNA helicase DinG [Rhodoferax sp.]